MWFKNLIIYRLTKPFEMSPDELEKRLEEFAFHPCGSQDQSKYGWAKPMGKIGQSLLHITNGNILVTARKEEKILPASVIKDALDEKVELIEQETARPVKKKEKDALKEEIIHSLLPRAFTRRGSTSAYISPALGLVVVDSSSHNRAEDLLALLRKSIGSLAVLPVQTKIPADHTMTGWLTGEEQPQGFSLLEEAELKSPEENGAVIRCKNQPLLSDEIRAHLDKGMMSVKLGLAWGESITFVLQEDMSIKRVKFTEVITEQQEEFDKDDKAGRFDADFALMAGEFEQLIPALVDVLGGEDHQGTQAD